MCAPVSPVSERLFSRSTANTGIIIILYKYGKLNRYKMRAHIFNLHFSNYRCHGMFITGLVFICATSIVNFLFIFFCLFSRSMVIVSS